MNKIDPTIVLQYFQANYKRGALLRFLMLLDDPNQDRKQKFGVVLNKDCTEQEAILAITTSQVQKFGSRFLEPDILRIPSGAYPALPKETIIDFRQLKIVPIKDLQTLCERRQMTFEGNLSAGDMMEVDQKLTASKLIERGLKKRIV